MDLGRYGSREIMNAQIRDYVTKKPIMYMDYANTAANEWTSETTYATGGAGAVRRIAFNGERQSTLTIETQIFTMQHLAMIAGRNVEKGSHNIFKVEVLPVEDDGTGGKQVVLSKTPINLNSISVFAFVNGIIADEQQVSSLTDKTVKLDASATVNIGDEVEVYYQYATTDSAKVSFTAKDFPKYVEIIGDTVFPDEVAGDIVSAQLVYYKAKLQPNFTLNLANSGDPTSISLVFDIFPVKVDGVDTLADIILYNE